MKLAKTFSPPRVKDELINRGLAGLNEEINKITRVLNMCDFKGLVDTPDAYTDQASKGLKVKASEDGLEFYTIVALPGTIANVLSNHTKAVHDALLITTLGTGAVAKDHGTPATDMLVNVCYGTGDPPAANTTTIGSLYVKYTA